MLRKAGAQTARSDTVTVRVFEATVLAASKTCSFKVSDMDVGDEAR